MVASGIGGSNLCIVRGFELGAMRNMFRSMGAEDYISKRIDQFQDWYDQKAVKAKSAFLRVRTTAVLGSALVPVVANLSIPTMAGYTVSNAALTTIISLIVVLAVALDSVNHYGDQWKN